MRDSTTDLLDLRGIGQRAESFRFDLLDPTLHLIGTVQPARDTPPSIENVMDRGIKRAMRGLVLPPGVADDVNMFSDRVRPVALYENGAEIAMGVFMFLIPTAAQRSFGATTTVDLADQGTILDEPLAETLGFSAQTLVYDALVTCMGIAGIPPSRFTIANTGAPIGGDGLTWKPGVSLLKAVNQLAQLQGCFSIYFDRDGTATVAVRLDLGLTEPSVIYRTGDDGNILDTTYNVSAQIVNAPNRYQVIDTSANDMEIVGFYTVPASAPNSMENIGFYRTRTVTTQGLPDVFAAQSYAQALAEQDAADYEWVSLSGVLDPRHDTFDVIQADGQRYREQAWGPVTLSPGAVMPHSLRRIYTDVAP